MPSEILSAFLKPWHDSLEDPQKTQEAVLEKLLHGYQQTGYGKDHGAEKAATIEKFRGSFPVVDYEGLFPFLEQEEKSTQPLSLR